MSENQNDDLAKVDDLEIEPLSDEALESVAGGTSGTCCTCSGDNCSSTKPATPIIADEF
jgi:hypothetical protein